MSQVDNTPRVGLLALPTELRLQIYEYILPNQDADTILDYHTLFTSNEHQVVIDSEGYAQHVIAGAAILRTCKQIYQEANSLLYSENRFTGGEGLTPFLKRIGAVNFAFIKTIDLNVNYDTQVSSGLESLRMLGENAIGLRRLRVWWNDGGDHAYPRGHPYRGLGDNIDFVRALGQIQGLEQLKITGQYAKNWPAYLRKSTGAEVQEEAPIAIFYRGMERLNSRSERFQTDYLRKCCLDMDPIELHSLWRPEEIKLEVWKTMARQLWGFVYEDIESFQAGTEDLIP